MKKNFFTKTALTIVVLLVSAKFSLVNAQVVSCPYFINNHMSCSITFQVTLFEVGLSCQQCSGPGNSFSVTVAANSSYQISCSDFTTACTLLTNYCDIKIAILAPITTAAVSPGGQLNISSLGSSCNATSGSQMVVSNSNCDLNP